MLPLPSHPQPKTRAPSPLSAQIQALPPFLGIPEKSLPCPSHNEAIKRSSKSHGHSRRPAAVLDRLFLETREGLSPSIFTSLAFSFFLKFKKKKKKKDKEPSQQRHYCLWGKYTLSLLRQERPTAGERFSPPPRAQGARARSCVRAAATLTIAHSPSWPLRGCALQCNTPLLSGLFILKIITPFLSLPQGPARWLLSRANEQMTCKPTRAQVRQPLSPARLEPQRTSLGSPLLCWLTLRLLLPLPPPQGHAAIRTVATG